SLFITLYFFFSSRRRHTRFKCDWSSDVCSSDLPDWLALYYEQPLEITHGEGRYVWDSEGNKYLDFFGGILTTMTAHALPEITKRSEERRVGKEWRCRSAADRVQKRSR